MLYRCLVLLHVAGAIAFFSNAIAAFFWKEHASTARHPEVIAHTFRTLMVADRWITPISVLVIVATGVAAALHAGLGILSTGWILWSLVAFILSGLVFGLRVLPLQRRLAEWTAESASSGTFDWDRYRTEATRWSHWAHVSILAATVALVLMVLRPDLPAL